MEKLVRRRYTLEHKQEAVRLVFSGKSFLSEMALLVEIRAVHAEARGVRVGKCRAQRMMQRNGI